ncbi:MAG TPA: hypothetical protein PKE21_08540 [Flavobacteriales bacterium]|nr:hypothetical protein [Flavobacteriales bacterium]HMR27509.1 hypothetical protein [Flavobacteriales bacterium]
MLRSLADYLHCWARLLADADGRKLIQAHARPLPVAEAPSPEDIKGALGAAMDWVARAQDHSGDGGMGSLHLVRGWGRTYPETTGYLIPTVLAAGERLGRTDLLDRAARAADTLLALQRADGGWQGGRVGEERPSVVFNSAQVVRGMLAMHARTGEQRFLDAAVRGGAWIVGVQEADGSWSRHNFMGAARVYDTYVDAPLLMLHRITGDPTMKEAALRNLAWVEGRQAANGWFADADNTEKHNERPIIHTLAYTMDGLAECGALLEDDRWTAMAEAAARPLCDRFLEHGVLHGRYDRSWNGSEAFITTGGAQLAVAWQRLARLGKDGLYADAAARMRGLLVALQARTAEGPPAARGGLTGSYPLWGRYEKFACPNWATKYLADALLCADGRTFC